MYIHKGMLGNCLVWWDGCTGFYRYNSTLSLRPHNKCKSSNYSPYSFYTSINDHII